MKPKVVNSQEPTIPLLPEPAPEDLQVDADVLDDGVTLEGFEGVGGGRVAG